jgi:CheY-like chemotaxis protein
MGQHCSSRAREPVLPTGVVNTNPTNNAAQLTADKVRTLQGIINNDSFRRALLKYLQQKKLEMFLNYYFEVEDLAKLNDNQILEQAEVLRDRYKHTGSPNTVIKPGFEEAREQWRTIISTFESEYKSVPETTNRSPRDDEYETMGKRVLGVFVRLQSKLLSYLSTYLDAFMESSYYQEILKGEKQREHDNIAKKTTTEVTKPVPNVEIIAESKTDTYSSKYKNILVVDDSKIATKIASVALKKAGHSCVIATHGRLALEELSKQRFHIVLIDLYMPIMDGFETIAKFRREQKSENAGRAAVTSSEVAMPDKSENLSTTQPNKSVRYSFHTSGSPDKRERIVVIGMSSDSDKETVKRAKDAGVDHFMSKPFSIEKLAEIIQLVENNPDWDSMDNQTNTELVSPS